MVLQRMSTVAGDVLRSWQLRWQLFQNTLENLVISFARLLSTCDTLS